MRRQGPIARWVVLSLALVAGVAVTTGGAEAAAKLRGGCDAGRPAVSYRVGKGIVRHHQPRRLIPCLRVIDTRTSESATVAVLRSGRALYAPLVENSYPAPLDDRGPAVIATSDDRFRHWHKIVPGDTNHILDVPPWMSVDPQTQRIWFASVLPDLCGAEISWSDDGGRSWGTNPAVGCPAMGSERILEGPSPLGSAKPVGYRHVVYYCANISDLSASTLPCYRSLDGGHSFNFTGSYPDPPPKQGCDAKHPARPGAVGSDGYLYLPVYRCGELSVALSRDEGATWRWIHVAKSNVQDLYTTSVAVDPAGNVYLAWIAGSPKGPPSSNAILGNGRPELSISRDHGRTWSRPVVVGPPRVKDAEFIAITARHVGELAISYLANTNGSTLLDGWLSVTRNALVRHALWSAASLNDPHAPLINTTDSTGFGDRLFFTTDAFGPNGEPWGAFHCAKTSACPGKRIGVVGWLTPAKKTRRAHHYGHGEEGSR